MRFLVWFVLVIAIIESFFAELLTKVILPIEILSSNNVFLDICKNTGGSDFRKRS